MVSSVREETADAAKALRRSLVRGGLSPRAFEAAMAAIPAAERDVWLDVLWEVDELPADDPLPAGCVPYLPCPVATIVEAVEFAVVTAEDVFVDVGAGLGRVMVLTHLLTGAECIGLEIQAGLVEAARGRAERLGLVRVRFIEGDAAERMGAVSTGTVFFLYCPFGGARLERVLGELESIARSRQIRICCVGMQALERPWLVSVASTSADLAVYRSNLHRILGGG